MDPQDARPDVPTRGRGPGPGTVTVGVMVLAFVVWVVFGLTLGGPPDECLTESVYGCMSVGNYFTVFGPMVVAGIGGIGSFVMAYLQARKGRPWGGWHAAGWVLLVLMLALSSMAMGAMMS